jgi:hypothetical protein
MLAASGKRLGEISVGAGGHLTKIICGESFGLINSIVSVADGVTWPAAKVIELDMDLDSLQSGTGPVGVSALVGPLTLGREGAVIARLPYAS